MEDVDKTKEQLVDEVAELRQRIAELEAVEIERKRAREALRESEEKYRLLVENATQTIVIAQDGMLKFFNPKAMEMTGYSQEELASRPFAELIHPDDLERTIAYYLGKLKGEETPQVYALRIIDKDGNVKWLESNAVLITWEGRPATLNFLSDITERKRAEEALEKRAAQLAVVSQVARRVASILDIDQLLQEFVSAIQQRFNYRNVALSLLDEAAGELEVRAVVGGFADMAPPGYRQAVGIGMTGWTAETGQSLLANDVSQEPRYIPGFLEEPLTQSELCVPLKLVGQVIGVLDVQDTQTNAFEETDLLAMETLADQLAVAIQNAQLYQETVQRLEETETFSAVTATLTRSLDLDQVLKSIVDFAARLIPAGTGGVIHLVDEVTGKLIPQATLAPEVNIQQKLEMSIGEGIAGLVAQEKQAINVPNVEEEPRFLTVDTASPKKSLLTVPLLMDKDCIGTLSLNSDQVGAFGADDQWLLTTLAAQAAVAVKNARLFEQAQQEIAERKRTEERIKFLAEVLSSSPLPVIATDKGEKIIYVNPTTERLFGYTSDELLGKNPIILNADPNADKIQRDIFDTIGQGRVWRGEILNKKKNGEVFPIYASVYQLLDEEGNFIATVGFQEDITERKKAEEALRESEERFRYLSEAAFEAIAIHEGGVLLSANDQFFRMFGFEPSELLGKQVMPLVVASKAREFMQKQIATGGLGPYESVGLRKDRTKFPLEIRVREMEYEDRKVRVGAIMDITERKRAEEKIRFQAHLLDAVGQAVIVTDLESTIIYWNHAAERLYGWSATEALGRDTVEVTVPQISQDEAIEIMDHLRADQSWSGEFLVQRRDGTVFPVLVTDTPVRDEQGKMVGIIGVSTDITERKQAEEALRKREQEIRMIAENVPALVSYVDAEGHYRFVNEQYEEWFGVPHTEIVGKHYRQVLGEDAYDRIKDRVQAALSGQRTSYEDALPYAHGGTRWVMADYVPDADDQGKVNGFFALVTDITERKQAEEALKQRAAQLALLNDIGGKITAVLDLNNLLDQAARLVQESFGYHHVALFILDHQRGELAMKARAGDFAYLFPPDHRLKLDQGLVGWVGYHGETLLANDVKAEPRYVNLYPDVVPTRSELSVPIRVGEEVVGVLDIQSPKLDAFDANDVMVIETLADQMAVAIENSRLLGAATKHREELQNLSAQLINAQEAERMRISRELHDQMGQTLTAMSINLAAVEKELPPEVAPTIGERLAETRWLADRTLEQVRQLSLDLRPSMLDDLGLVPTLRWYVNRYAQMLNIETEFEAMDLEGRLPAEMETVLYRVAQEALTNIARHAQASKVHIRLERKKAQVRAFIEDDGRGFDVREVAGRQVPERGIGLLGMRERVASLGGKFSIRSRPGRGTRLTIEIPI